MKSLFDEMGGTYPKVGDYYLPNLLLPPEKKYSLGKYDRMLHYLKRIDERCIQTC